MNTYRNTEASTEGQMTRVSACEATEAPGANWIEEVGATNNLTHLFTKAGVRYFGHL